MQQAPTNNNQMRTAAIVTIVVIIGLLLLGRFVTGMSGNTTTPTTSDTTTNNNDTLNPANTNNTTTLNNLGPVVAAQAIDRDNCAVDATTHFTTTDPVYVVLVDSQLPQGTTMFARLYKDGVAIEDTKELTADQDYNNTCVNFVFRPSQSAETWQPGTYEAEFFVNGNSYRSTTFDIR
jgi:hypothetical protein